MSSILLVKFEQNIKKALHDWQVANRGVITSNFKGMRNANVEVVHKKIK